MVIHRTPISVDDESDDRCDVVEAHLSDRGVTLITLSA